jgi:hypothetical protein
VILTRHAAVVVLEANQLPDACLSAHTIIKLIGGKTVSLLNRLSQRALPEDSGNGLCCSCAGVPGGSARG